MQLKKIKLNRMIKINPKAFQMKLTANKEWVILLGDYKPSIMAVVPS